MSQLFSSLNFLWTSDRPFNSYTLFIGPLFTEVKKWLQMIWNSSHWSEDHDPSLCVWGSLGLLCNILLQQNNVEVTHGIYSMPLLPGHLGTFALMRNLLKIFLLGSQLPCHRKPTPYKEVTCSWLTFSESLLSPFSDILAQGPDMQVKSHLRIRPSNPSYPSPQPFVSSPMRSWGTSPCSMFNGFLRRAFLATLWGNLTGFYESFPFFYFSFPLVFPPSVFPSFLTYTPGGWELKRANHFASSSKCCAESLVKSDC